MSSFVYKFCDKRDHDLPFDFRDFKFISMWTIFI